MWRIISGPTPSSAAGLTVREVTARVKVGKTALYEALGASATGPAT